MLDIKPTHKPIKDYYVALKDFERIGIVKETSVRNAFQELLTYYSRKLKWNFIEEYTITLKNKNKGSVDGAIVDTYNIVMGYWEAKDSKDDLKKEIKSKFDDGYPKANILFQEPKLAVLYQDGKLVSDYDLTDPDQLVSCLEDFFNYKAEEVANWEELVENFKQRIPESARKLIAMIEEEKKSNAKFKEAFKKFADLCRASINPNLADEAIEEMLVQHLLTSRIFASVFDNSEFLRRNVIAAEIETVIDALTSRSFNKKEFFAPLDHFYVGLERRAQSITEWSQKQSFLNTVYEKFFQGFAVKVADTHGIVYTPQPIVDFMVRSVEHILKTEFNRSLSDKNVHILDPFVGTGNFIMRIMREIKRTALPHKYANELHCNEVMLLPYYIASMNIEHEYFTETGKYEPFQGICMVDTFELAEPDQGTLFSTENTERVKRQKESPIFVIVGNPPYNAGQVNENDNNKNRKYPVVDKRVYERYVDTSRATLNAQLGDPYVKAFRFASDRIGKHGVVGFVSNNSFINGFAFDGMRKSLAEEFQSIYVLDLGGNVRKNPKLSGTTHNVFGIQVGVSINILVKKQDESTPNKTKLFYARVDEFWRRTEKYRFLNQSKSINGIEWKEVVADQNGNWLDNEESESFDSNVPIGLKETRGESNPKTVFSAYSNGVKTNRDIWCYSFNKTSIEKNISITIQEYNEQAFRFNRLSPKPNIDKFVENDDKQISWSETLKSHLKRGILIDYNQEAIRKSIYRPFTSKYLYFDKILVDRRLQFPKIFPSVKTESENIAISLPGAGGRTDFWCYAANQIMNLSLTSLDSCQCFPFYTYNEDGTGRRENITDWALEEFKRKAKKIGCNNQVGYLLLYLRHSSSSRIPEEVCG